LNINWTAVTQDLFHKGTFSASSGRDPALLQTRWINGAGEIGRLGKALNHMTSRLYGFVKGQKRFLGDAAIRWVYGGTRFSEDLDFVTPLSAVDIHKIVKGISKKIHNACIAQFGPGQSEQNQKSSRKDAFKIFFIFRPQASRERIAVKLEFEILKQDLRPEIQKVVLRDLPSVAGLLRDGTLIMSYSSSVLLVETSEEILADKIRAIYERTDIKGRDIYDIWWITKHHRVKPSWPVIRAKLEMYKVDFCPARKTHYFQQKKNTQEITKALERDLPRFIPQEIYALYQENNFKEFTDTLKDVTAEVSDRGLKKYLDSYE
jgi:predicted nucleotidyltransferase component of viral defense system